jgi:hypothetical protein
MTRILIVIALVLAAGVVHGQQNCAQTLRLANSSYDQGRLHELPGLLKGCLTSSNGFSNAEKVTAYKLLVLSYIYLEEPAKADSTMIELLNADHFFEPNQSVDPAEFIGLYNTFRTKPIFSIGVKFGVNLTQVNVLANYYTGGDAVGNGKYSSSIGIQGGFSFEKNLFQRSKKQFLNRLILAPEILYVARSFGYTNTPINSIAATNLVNQVFSESQTWLDLNALLQYQLNSKSRFNPYVTLGPGISYLLGTSSSGPTTRGTTGNVVSGPAIDLANSYNKIVYSVTAGAGAKIKLGGLYLTGELRYQYGLVNAVNPDKRTNIEYTFDYAAQLNDFSINNISFLFGASYPVFKPQKLKKKK